MVDYILPKTVEKLKEKIYTLIENDSLEEKKYKKVNEKRWLKIYIT